MDKPSINTTQCFRERGVRRPAFLMQALDWHWCSVVSQWWEKAHSWEFFICYRPGKLWRHYLWRYSRPCWMKLWTVQWEASLPMAGGMEIIRKDSSNTNHSTVLCFFWNGIHKIVQPFCSGHNSLHLVRNCSSRSRSGAVGGWASGAPVVQWGMSILWKHNTHSSPGSTLSRPW